MKVFLAKRARPSMCTRQAQNWSKIDENGFSELKFPENVDDSCTCWVHILLVRAWENGALIWF